MKKEDNSYLGYLIFGTALIFGAAYYLITKPAPRSPIKMQKNPKNNPNNNPNNNAA